jgi:hypothetical protein
VPIARKEETWSTACLGKMAKEHGVYVIHHGAKIKYVGKTDGPAMSFGRRLRAEFREKSSRGRHIYPKLNTLEVPPEIRVHCYPVSEIKKRITTDGRALNSFQMIGIFETAMIYHLNPEFQHHHLNAVAKHIQKVILKTTGKTLDESNREMFMAKVKDMLK